VDRDQLPYTVQAINGDDLRQANATNLTDYMTRNLAGVNANDIQGSPFQTDITYRGYRASSIPGVPQGLSVYLDGIRVNEPFGDVVSWDMIPEAALENVLLVSGANPTYGLNTLGGTIAMTTRSGLTTQGFTADFSYGSWNRGRIDLSAGGKTEDGWHIFAAGTLFGEDGWRDHSDGSLGNIFLKAGHADDTNSWDVSVLHGQSRLIGNGLLPSIRVSGGQTLPGLYETNPASVYTYPDRTESQLTQVALNGRHWFDAKTSLSAMAYLRNSRRDTVNGDVNPEYEEYADACEDGFNADGSPRGRDCSVTQAEGAALHPAVLNSTHMQQRSLGAALSFARETDKHQISAGLTFDYSKISYAQYTQLADFTSDRGVVADPDAPTELFSGVNGSSRTFGLYASDTWALTPTTFLTGSARWNYANVNSTLRNSDGTDQPREAFTYTRVNPALGIAQKVGYGATLFAGWAQNNRVPTVLELGCANPDEPCRLPAGLQSDPYLKQVITQTFETGARWSPSRDTDVSLAFYRASNHDDILFLRAPNTQQGYFANFDRTRNQGIDLAARQRLGPVTLRLAYSYLDATYQSSGQLAVGERTINVTPGMRVAGVPRNTVKLSADWQAFPGFLLGADLIGVSDSVISGNEDGLRADPVAGRTPRTADWSTAGYALVNLRASYRINKHVEVYARVTNLFNRRYETYGQIAEDVFPNGTLLQPHINPQDAASARFVAPGAPRGAWFGVVLRM
jgi:outer membrane receptor protein involved in Fe transport